MTNIYCIDFYPKDWLAKTAQLDPDERGIYIQIVMLIYAHGGPILNDAAWISRSCGCSSRLVRSIVDRLAAMGKIDIIEGMIYNNRAEAELAVKRKRVGVSSNAGTVSAENRAKTARKSLENDANLSRTSSETEADLFENKDLTSTSPLPSPPLGSKKEYTEGENEVDEDEIWFQEKFWDPYPKARAGSKEKARVAMKKALTKTTKEELENAVRNYAASDEVERGYAKGAAAWLNDERWSHDYRPAHQAKVAGGQRHKPKTSYMDKIHQSTEKARAILQARMDADSGQPWSDKPPE